MKKSSEVTNQFLTGLGLFLAFLFISCLVFFGSTYVIMFLGFIWHGDILGILACLIIAVLVSLGLGMVLGNKSESVE